VRENAPPPVIWCVGEVGSMGRIFRARPELHGLIKATTEVDREIKDGFFAGIKIVTSKAIPPGCMALAGESETIVCVVDGEEFERWLGV
jgi:hypothetical protein